MVISDRLRAIREQKDLSQGDIEKRTGLLRCYVSRVENGHTVPSIETLEKMARALEVPMYQLFYDGLSPPSFCFFTIRKWANFFTHMSVIGPSAGFSWRLSDSSSRLQWRAQWLTPLTVMLVLFTMCISAGRISIILFGGYCSCSWLGFVG